MSSTSAPAPDIRHNQAARRFELAVEGGIAHADYRLDGGVMRLVHTEVPREAGGRGVAGRVVRAALEHARRQGLQVVPVCSYVRAYMRRHPETRDLHAASALL
jgi:predicted GNAT family acetyltransferase